MSARDGAIELLNKWKSEGSLTKVLFFGTKNLRTFTLHGKISDVGESVRITGSDDSLVDFSFALARFSVGRPKGDEPAAADLFAELRFKEVSVVEIFADCGYILLFPVLNAADTSHLVN